MKWLLLREKLGERYADCRLSNFELHDGDNKIYKRQEKVVNDLWAYAANMKNYVSWGAGIVLYGPPGTGKDHLLVAMMRKACWHNFDVVWGNGMDLYAARRDAISRDTPERELIRKYTTPDVLAISDPVPPWGNLTEGQAEFLFRIVDARYRRRKPIWISANFAEGKEAESRVGTQVIDRLRDGSLALHCNWPSYRKSQ